MIERESTLEDICFAVAEALESHDMPAVLCGGSAAAIYAPQAYMSADADFVLNHDDSLDDVAVALETIGFRREGRSRIFSHPHTLFTVDFPKGPLAVGGDYVRETSIIERGAMRLRIVTRTDCVRDRLAHFYHWNDYTALNAAVAVAANGIDDIDMALLEAWTRREDEQLEEKLAEFKRRLHKAIGT
ncbi:MAG TPA: hypothetical protein VNF68_14115 [Candidatus Baltobacteraceae bacterium]|nr:hypothetical protein [Candidatus Baltobacteraceae bacterium]